MEEYTFTFKADLETALRISTILDDYYVRTIGDAESKRSSDFKEFCRIRNTAEKTYSIGSKIFGQYFDYKQAELKKSLVEYIPQEYVTTDKYNNYRSIHRTIWKNTETNKCYVKYEGRYVEVWRNNVGYTMTQPKEV